MTKFLILFAIVALASVNAQFNPFDGFPGNFFPGFPLPLPLFPPLTPESIVNIKPGTGVVSGSFVASTTRDGKTETIMGTNTNGQGDVYHIKS